MRTAGQSLAGLVEDRSWQAWALVGAGAVLTVLAVVLLVRALRRRRRARRPRTLVAVVGGLVSLLLLVTTGALAAAVAVGYVTDLRGLGTLASDVVDDDPTALPRGEQAQPPEPTTATTGVAWEVTVPSTAAGVPDSATWVYVPPGYSQDADRTYPVLYALHGSPGSGSDWIAAGHLDQALDGLVAAGTVPPMIVVAPDMDLGPTDEPVDYPGDGPQRGTFLLQDVVPWADSHLRTTADGAHRLLGGMSSGGFGALVLGVEHPDVFAGVVSLLPYLEPEAPELTGDPAALAAVEPLQVIARATFPTALPVFLGVPSDDDPSWAAQIAAALQAKGQPVTTVDSSEGHGWGSASELMPQGLAWVVDRLGWSAAPPSSAPSSSPSSSPSVSPTGGGS